MIAEFFQFLWSSFLLLAPMLLLGLFLSGLIHVFIPKEAILRWFKDDSLKSIATSAGMGVPIPLCSCSVVPVVAEMHHKGASRSACMSFLITAPETGADSILVTNAFFGPVVAIVRPLISFITAVVAGLLCMCLPSNPKSLRQLTQSAGGDATPEECRESALSHAGHQTLYPNKDDCYVSPKQLLENTISWRSDGNTRIKSWRTPKSENSIEPHQPGADPSKSLAQQQETEEKPPDLLTVVKHMLHYGFVEIADDILFALLVGLVLGGFLYLVIPADITNHEYARWLAYPVLLLVSVPLYICASASTPIAAALVAKGVSPGAALVFLMTGPATNTATIAVVVSQFGKRFASIYVLGVILVTVVIGITLDFLLLTAGISIAVNLEASESPAILAFQWVGATLLMVLIVWRFKSGALRSGYNDLLANLRPAQR